MYLIRHAVAEDLDQLREFMRNRRIRVRAEDGTVRVSVPDAPTPMHERRELTGCVATWNALNPDSQIDLVGTTSNGSRARLTENNGPDQESRSR
ncbi:MAG TPA: hypothetical protein VIM33_07150 [Gaiellaceae bacterium]